MQVNVCANHFNLIRILVALIFLKEFFFQKYFITPMLLDVLFMIQIVLYLLVDVKYSS